MFHHPRVGHDAHFLQRLDRVTRTEMDFALNLYRDHESVRWLLARARVPEGTDRIAIALTDDPEPAHIVVARSGSFVTCLARGMTIGSTPRITREQLDRYVSQSHGLRERLQMDEVRGTNYFRRIIVSGRRLSREDFIPYVQLMPLVDASMLCNFFELSKRLLESAPDVIAEARKSRPDEEVLHNYWNLYHAVSHLCVLVGVGVDAVWRFFEAAPLARKNFPSSMWLVCRHGLLSGMTRAGWTCARIGNDVFLHMMDMLLNPNAVTHTITGWACATGAGLKSDPRVRDAFSTGLGPEDRPRKDDSLFIISMREFANTMKDPAGTRRTGLRAAEDRLATIMSDEAFKNLGPEELASLLPAVFGSLEFGAVDAIAHGWFDLVADAVATTVDVAPETLYFPRAWIEEYDPPWTIDDTRRLLELPTLEAKKVATVKNVAAVGRNEQCPCGSGRKFKKCCRE